MSPSSLPSPSSPPCQPGYLHLHEQPVSRFHILTQLLYSILNKFLSLQSVPPPVCLSACLSARAGFAEKRASVGLGISEKNYTSSFPLSISLPPLSPPAALPGRELGPAAGARCPLPAAAAGSETGVAGRLARKLTPHRLVCGPPPPPLFSLSGFCYIS